MGTAVRGQSFGLPRTRVLVAAAGVVVVALLIWAFMWGPLGSARQANIAGPTTAALLNAGLSAQVAGRTAEAEDDFQKVLMKDPNNFWAYYNLGVIDQQSGRVELAEREYRSALKINPDFVPALYNLAIIRTPVNAVEAEDLYRHAIQVQPGSATAHLNLGFLLIHQGKKAEGQAELEKAVKLDPTLATRIPVSPTATPKK